MRKFFKILILGPLAFAVFYLLARFGVSFISESFIDLDVIFIALLFLAVLSPIFVYITDLEGEKALFFSVWMLAMLSSGLLFWSLDIQIMGSFAAKDILLFTEGYMVIFLAALLVSYFKQPTQQLLPKQVAVYSLAHLLFIFSYIMVIEFSLFR